MKLPALDSFTWNWGKIIIKSFHIGDLKTISCFTNTSNGKSLAITLLDPTIRPCHEFFLNLVRERQLGQQCPNSECKNGRIVHRKCTGMFNTSHYLAWGWGKGVINQSKQRMYCPTKDIPPSYQFTSHDLVIGMFHCLITLFWKSHCSPCHPLQSLGLGLYAHSSLPLILTLLYAKKECSLRFEKSPVFNFFTKVRKADYATLWFTQFNSSSKQAACDIYR
jgi:hypothetical protein